MDERNTRASGAERRPGTASPAVRATTGEQETGREPGDARHTDGHRAQDYDPYTERRMEPRADRSDTGNGHDTLAGRTPLTLMRQLVADVAVLFRKEVALAAAEVNHSVHGVTSAAGSMLSGGAILHAGIIFLLAAAAFGLARVMAPWLATLIVGGIVTLVGIVMLQAGKKKLEPASFKPERTVDSLRKDREALRRHKP